MQNHLLVSVIIPTYNRARTLCAAIESVLAQTYTHVEIVVVDDGSTDGTDRVLQQYDGRLRVIRQRNTGPAAARNAGVRNSGGELLAFLDSDDIWMPDKLKLQVEALSLAGESVQCCVCNVRVLQANGKAVSSFKRAHLQPRCAGGTWLNPFEVQATRFLFFNQASLIRRTAFEQVNGYDEGLRFLEDTDLGLRIALLSPWAFVAESLVVWQQSADSLSREALSQNTLLKQSELSIRSRLCVGNEKLRGNRKWKKLMDGEVRRNRRELRAVMLGQAQTPWMRKLALTLAGLERLRLAIFRRSPWYPTMRVTSFTSFPHAEYMTVENSLI